MDFLAHDGSIPTIGFIVESGNALAILTRVLPPCRRRR